MRASRGKAAGFLARLEVLDIRDLPHRFERNSSPADDEAAAFVGKFTLRPAR